MPTFGAGNGAFTPATNQDNWCHDADTAGDFSKIVSIMWGGRSTTSKGYRTRWVRPTNNGTGIFTQIANEAHSPGYRTPLCVVGTWATAPTLPTDPDNLYATDWNSHGGLGYTVLPLNNPWWITNSSTHGDRMISCRNVAGTDANESSYALTWEEP